jgi:hypothetical protein
MRLAVIQHRLRTHLRMDLAALLSASERAFEEGARAIVYPRLPDAEVDPALLDALFRNIGERCPGLAWVTPRIRHRPGEQLECRPTVLGRTLVLLDDDCIDPALFPAIQELGCEALVWLFTAEDDLQAEAALETALDASLTLTPLVVVAAVTGEARGAHAHGTSAIAHLGELLAEGGSGDDVAVADLAIPAAWVDRARRLPELAPVLAQRLAAHRGSKVAVDYPADLS